MQQTKGDCRHRGCTNNHAVGFFSRHAGRRFRAEFCKLRPVLLRTLGTFLDFGCRSLFRVQTMVGLLGMGVTPSACWLFPGLSGHEARVGGTSQYVAWVELKQALDSHARGNCLRCISHGTATKQQLGRGSSLFLALNLPCK